MLIGHGKIIEDLKCLAAGRKLAQGYVFYGPAMVGKRTAALNFANFLESGDFSEPKLLSDALLIEPSDMGTVGVDAVRAIKNFLWQKPNVSAYRTVIIDDAELMTQEAGNALLKVAEEPPPSALLILVASDIDGLPETVLSRLQKIYFPTVPGKLIKEWAKKEFPEVKNLDVFIDKSFGLSAEALAKAGKPGLLAAMVRDKKFQALLKSAEDLLKLKSDRRDFIKKLLAPEDFDLSKFLDALLIVISASAADNKNKTERWHKFLELRREVAYFNLNPRLQLENLFT